MTEFHHVDDTPPPVNQLPLESGTFIDFAHDRFAPVAWRHNPIPISRSLYDELIRDQADLLCWRLDAEILGAFEPWRRPDRNPFPAIDLFPRATRAVRRTSYAVHFARQRMRDIAHVVLHGMPDEDDW